MNQYLLSVYGPSDGADGADGAETSPSTPEQMQGFMARVMALEEEMETAGAFAFGGALHGADAATVVSGGMDKVTIDGPFVEAKEHIAGFYIVNAESLDEALSWAAKVSHAIGQSIEVRPFRATGRLKV